MGNTVFNIAVQGSHGQGAGLFFLTADGENQRDILQLGFAHFFIEALGPAVDLNAQPGALQDMVVWGRENAVRLANEATIRKTKNDSLD